MKNKSEVLHHFHNFISYVNTQFSTTIKQFQNDGGGKYDNKNFAQFCSSLGIHHRLSCPHTPVQNGLAERKHRHIADIARTILSVSHVPLRHWPEAVSTTVYLINRLPSHKLQWSSPYSRLHGHPPSYSELRVFGCACYPHLGAYLTNKLLPRIVECVFLGYSMQHKGYRCLDRRTNRVYISRHVRFNEDHFPFTSSTASSAAPSSWAFVPVLPPLLPLPISTPQSPQALPTVTHPATSPSSPAAPSSPPIRQEE